MELAVVLKHTFNLIMVINEDDSVTPEPCYSHSAKRVSTAQEISEIYAESSRPSLTY
jgi:hypothetical protein